VAHLAARKIAYEHGRRANELAAWAAKTDLASAGANRAGAVVGLVLGADLKLKKVVGLPSVIQHREVFPACLEAESASQPRFAYSGRSHDILPRNSNSTF
jgi:hypothetical protein